VWINHVDIAPTTLGLCGIDPPDWMRGTDYSGWRLRERPRAEAPDSVFIQSVVPTGHAPCIDKPWRGIITRDGWKYVTFEAQPWQLFHLDDDPYELANLVHYPAYSTHRNRLHKRLATWIAQTGDPFELPDI
jgi:arylsulfatase A-like enzyme